MATNEFDIVLLGTSGVDAETGMPVVQAVNPIGEDETDVEQFGDVPMFGALGVTALPAPKTEKGAAEGVILRSCAGYEGLCVGARDSRTNKTVGDLGAGETVLHATGEGYESRVACKEQMVAIVVGDPVQIGLIFDNLAQKVQLSAFGHLIEVSEEQGIVLTAAGGKSFISIKDETIWLKAPKVLLGDQPVDLAIKVDTTGAPMPVGPSTSVLIGP